MESHQQKFSFGQIVKLSGVTSRALEYWAATGFLPPSIQNASGTGTKRVYSYSDAIAARVVKHLRAAGVPFANLKRLVKRLRTEQQYWISSPGDRLVVFGDQAIIVATKNDLFEALKKVGENYPACAFILPFGRIVNELKIEASKVQSEQTTFAFAAPAPVTPIPRKPVQRTSERTRTLKEKIG